MIVNNTYLGGPAYILEDGSFINLKENGIRNHVDYERKQGTLERRRRTLTRDCDLIRINDRVPYEVLIELPFENNVTEEQYGAIELFLNNLIDRGIYQIEVGIEPNGSEILRWSKDAMFYGRYDLLEIKPEYLINKIKEFYRQKKTGH